MKAYINIFEDLYKIVETTGVFKDKKKAFKDARKQNLPYAGTYKVKFVKGRMKLKLIQLK